MKECQLLSELMENCALYFEQQSYSPSSISHYKWLWKNKLAPYMNQKSILYYDRSVGEEFIQSKVTGPIISDSVRDIVRCINVLSDFHDKGAIRKRHCNIIRRDFDGPIGQLMEKFLLHLTTLRRNAETILHYQLHLSRLLIYLNSKQIFTVKDITELHVLSFISTQTNRQMNIVSNIRMFLKFLFEEDFLEYDLSTSLHNYKWVNKDKLPSVYSSEEVLQIESAIHRSDATGKRDYAIMLFASRLGLRASDIAHLTFDNINWENGYITFSQIKTKKIIELPLLADIGNSLIDYLKYGRKKSDSNRIFLYSVAPFTPMTGDAVSAVFRRAIYASGVDISHRKHGSHSMRHSLAARFLENQESIPIISEALGHQSTNATMSYLRIDIENLRKCALHVPPVEKSFYEQKGGAFYE